MFQVAEGYLQTWAKRIVTLGVHEWGKDQRMNQKYIRHCTNDIEILYDYPAVLVLSYSLTLYEDKGLQQRQLGTDRGEDSALGSKALTEKFTLRLIFYEIGSTSIFYTFCCSKSLSKEAFTLITTPIFIIPFCFILFIFYLLFDRPHYARLCR